MSATNRAAVHEGYQDGAPNQIAEIEVSRLSRAECAELLAQTKFLEGRLLARLLTSDESAAHKTNSEGDTLLDAKQVAKLLNVKVPYVYRNGRKLGLAVQVSENKLRYSRAAVQAFIAEKRVPKPPKPHARSGKKAA